MAGDWIKMRLDLQTHPKVVRILSATKADKFRVIGGLHAVWSVFDTHSSDGRLNGYSAETLDHIIGWAGFSDAIIAVGWLLVDGEEALLLPDFDEHNGKSGKRRAEDQKRKRADRKSPENVRNPSETEADKKRTREEKRREDSKPIKSKTKTPAAPTFDPKPDMVEHGVAEQTIADWLALRAKKRAPVTATVLSQLLREATTAGMSLDATLALCCVRGWTGFEASWVQKTDRGGHPGTSTKFNPSAHVNRNRKANA